MASWQARLADPFLRYYVKPKLAGAGTADDARRAFSNPWRKLLPSPRGITVAPALVGGVIGEWVQSGTAGAQMLYLHGGGYFACSPKTHRAITGAYARHDIKVFAADYRLAPEHPFPAALDDALAAYRGMIELGISPAELIVAGDSAGGGLALATLLAAKNAGLPMPACALLFSPWTDLAGTGESLVTNRQRDPMLVSERLREGGDIYLNGADPENPLASPLYGDLAGLPPLLIQVGEGEILRDDSTRLAERATKAGVQVDLKIWPGMPHVWQISQNFLPEARDALNQAVDFARSHLQRPEDLPIA
jgi:acetyl esterase/lipase